MITINQDCGFVDSWVIGSNIFFFLDLEVLFLYIWFLSKCHNSYGVESAGSGSWESQLLNVWDFFNKLIVKHSSY